MTDAEKLAAASKAINYVLNRVQTDADLYHVLCPMTEAHSLLCEAEAAIRGEEIETVKTKRAATFHRYPRRFLSRSEHEEEESE